MRQMISGLVAAAAVVAASTAPAMACGCLFTSGGVAPVYSPLRHGLWSGYGTATATAMAGYERLP